MNFLLGSGAEKHATNQGQVIKCNFGYFCGFSTCDCKVSRNLDVLTLPTSLSACSLCMDWLGVGQASAKEQADIRGKMPHTQDTSG